MKKITAIFYIVRFTLNILSCILYILQTCQLQSDDLTYPTWCCAHNIMYFSYVSPINKQLNIAFQQLSPNCIFSENKVNYSLLYSNFNHSVNNWPSYLRYSKWNGPPVCSLVNNTNCFCAIECNNYIICAKKLNTSENQYCFANSNYLEQGNLYLLKFLIYQKPVWLWVMQLCVSTTTMFLCILYTIIISNRQYVRNFLEFGTILDIVIGLLFLFTMIYPPCLKDVFIPSFLHAISGVQMLKWVILDIDTFTIHRRWFTHSTQRTFNNVANIISFIYTAACSIDYVEKIQPQSFEGDSPNNLAESAYLLLITITTVGYGDFSPTTWLGRVLIVILILTVLLYLPGLIEDMLGNLTEYAHYCKSAYSNPTSNLIIVCVSEIKLHFLLDILNEIYADEDLSVNTVILCPKESDQRVVIRLNNPTWKKQVLLLLGSALNKVDLDRAGIKIAKACFIYADRNSYDPDLSDQETILRAYSIRSFSPSCKLFLHILKPENICLVNFAAQVLCEGEIKHAIYASNCLCPGFSTYLSLLLHTTSPKEESENCIYNYGSGHEIYDIKAKDFIRISSFLDTEFLKAAIQVHRKLGVLMIGLQKSNTNDIILNPGNSCKLEREDTIFYISQTSEYNKEGINAMKRYMKKIELLSKKKGISDLQQSMETESTYLHSQSSLTQQKLSLIKQQSNTDDQLRELDAIPKAKVRRLVKIKSTPKVAPAGRRQSKTKLNPYSSTILQNTLNKPQNIHLGAFTIKMATTSNTGYGEKTFSNRTQSKDKSEAQIKKIASNRYDISDNDVESVSSIDEKVDIINNGFPKQIPYMIPNKNRYHIVNSPRNVCCLEIGWKPRCHEKDVACKTRVVQQRVEYSLYPSKYKNGIIVIADDAGPQLYNFIHPLRASYIPTEELNPIVLFINSMNNPLDTKFLESISYFPNVRYMTGSVNDVDDILISGIMNARQVIICLGDGILAEKEEEHMTDASKLQCFIKYKQLFPNITFTVEIFHRTNMEILSARNDDSKDLNSFLSTPYFMSGQVFSPSLLDTALYQSKEKEYLIRLVRILLGLDQCSYNNSLTYVKKEDHILSECNNYGEVLKVLSNDRQYLVIGIYRKEFNIDITENRFQYVHDILPFINDRLINLNMPPTNLRKIDINEGNYKVLVNPIADIPIYPTDTFLVIRSPYSSSEINGGPSISEDETVEIKPDKDILTNESSDNS